MERTTWVLFSFWLLVVSAMFVIFYHMCTSVSEKDDLLFLIGFSNQLYLSSISYFLSITFVIKCLYNKFDINTDTVIPINCIHIESVKFVHHRARSNAAHHSLFHRFPRLWDELPACIKYTIIHSLSSFTNSLRNHLLVPGEEVPLTKTV